jgi:hypothetical protein
LISVKYILTGAEEPPWTAMLRACTPIVDLTGSRCNADERRFANLLQNIKLLAKEENL